MAAEKPKEVVSDQVTVTIGAMGKDTATVVVMRGTTVRDVLTQQGVDLKGLVLQIGERNVELDTELSEDCTLLYTPPVKHG
jgi:chorismate synthase